LAVPQRSPESHQTVLRATCRCGIDAVGIVERTFGNDGDYGRIGQQRTELVNHIDLHNMPPCQRVL
jgi:hypothetical protein